MQTTLAEIAGLVDGKAFGNEQAVIRGTGTISSARQGEITFADSRRTIDRLSHCVADAVLVPLGLKVEDRAYIQVEDVREAFAKIVEHFHPRRETVRRGVSSRANVSPGATIGNDVDIHDGAVVYEDVQIGDGCTIHSNVVLMPGCRIAENVTIFPGVILYEDSIIGARCILHANCVIGAYGFGYNSVDGSHKLGAQLGYVELESDVDLGAGTTVDRGSYGATTIGQGTKIDNQVQIAHNCRVGRHNIFCSQSGIAGSSSTGDYVVVAGQVGITDHIRVGDQVTIGAKSGVMRDVPSGQTVLGVPARPERSQMQTLAAMQRLPEMRKQLRAIVRQVEAMAAEGDDGPRQEDRQEPKRDAA